MGNTNNDALPPKTAVVYRQTLRVDPKVYSFLTRLAPLLQEPFLASSCGTSPKARGHSSQQVPARASGLEQSPAAGPAVLLRTRRAVCAAATSATRARPTVCAATYPSHAGLPGVCCEGALVARATVCIVKLSEARLSPACCSDCTGRCWHHAGSPHDAALTLSVFLQGSLPSALAAITAKCQRRPGSGERLNIDRCCSRLSSPWRPSVRFWQPRVRRPFAMPCKSTSTRKTMMPSAEGRTTRTLCPPTLLTLPTTLTMVRVNSSPRNLPPPTLPMPRRTTGPTRPPSTFLIHQQTRMTRSERHTVFVCIFSSFFYPKPLLDLSHGRYTSFVPDREE